MEQKTLSKWLKCILVGVAVCGLITYAVVIPMCGMSLRAQYPEFSNRFWPWMVFLWASGIPCFAVLVFAWKIAAAIGRDASFSLANAKCFERISVLSAADAAFFFVGNILLWLLNMSHPSVVLVSLVVVFVGVAVAVVSAVLSRLMKKAAALQEQSDWTI